MIPNRPALDTAMMSGFHIGDHWRGASEGRTFGQYPKFLVFMRIQVFVTVTYVLTPLLVSAAAVDTYAELTGKTVLAPSALPSLPDSIDSELPANKTNVIVFLEKEFSKKGISVVQDGPCFVRFVPGG